MTTNHNWLKWHWKLKLYRFIDIFFIRYFDLIITASDKIKEEMLQYHIAENKIRVIDYGINIEDFDTPILNGALRKELGIHENEKIIGTIGRLKTEKGHIFLLQAAKEILKQFKDIKVVIVGDGPLRNQLEAQARTFGIEKNIIFTGHRKEKLELLTMMDIVVLPSVEEGLPIALLEAMAAKRPVIATRVGAIPKVIKDHENGILIPPKDADALQKSVCHLLGDPRLSHRLAVEANLTVKMNFTSERMCKKYYKLYVELTNRN
jgi:glycosyltransferase involved in cell wall biosynthesis